MKKGVKKKRSKKMKKKTKKKNKKKRKKRRKRGKRRSSDSLALTSSNITLNVLFSKQTETNSILTEERDHKSELKGRNLKFKFAL